MLEPLSSIAPSSDDIDLARTLMRVVEWSDSPSPSAVDRLARMLAESRIADDLLAWMRPRVGFSR